MKRRFLILVASIAAVSLVASCGPDTPTTPDAFKQSGIAASSGMPGAPGAARERLFYKAKLEPQGAARAVGVALIDVVGGELRVRIHANGLNAGQHIPQHIHVNPGCSPGGGVLVNLDANLTVPGEAPPIGAAYPVANRAGVVNFEASRSLSELMAALNYYRNAGLTSEAELLAWLDLANRNVHMHTSTAPYTPLNCGGIDLVN